MLVSSQLVQVSNTIPAGEYEYWPSLQTISGPVVAVRTFPQFVKHGEPGATKIAADSGARTTLAVATESFNPSIVKVFSRERRYLFFVSGPPDQVRIQVPQARVRTALLDSGVRDKEEAWRHKCLGVCRLQGPRGLFVRHNDNQLPREILGFSLTSKESFRSKLFEGLTK